MVVAFRRHVSGLVGTLVALATGAAAHAQYEPVIVLSGRAGVPVIINGRDATGSVVEGDWGLARPGTNAVSVFNPGAVLIPLPPRGAYYPATGEAPGYGRREIDTPARPTPPPADGYYRSWSTPADTAPVTISPNYEMPSVVTVPGQRRPPRQAARPRRMR